MSIVLLLLLDQFKCKEYWGSCYKVNEWKFRKYYYNQIEMGANQVSCQNNRPGNKLLQRQIRLYQWRAEHKHDCIPAIEFKAQTYLQQQQILQKYIGNNSKDYMPITQLKQQLEALGDKQEDVITFEKNACKLVQLTHCLRREEVIYAILSLLTAFQQIKKIFTRIPVSPFCCFVSMKGQVKGWINSNPKSNKVQSNILYNEFEERQYKQIIEQILKMAEEMALPDLSLQYAIDHVRLFLKNIKVRNDMFEVVRQQLTAYCGRHNIEISNNLAALLRRKQLNILKFQRRNSANKSEYRETTSGSLDNSTHIQSYRNSIEKQTRPASPQTNGFASFGYLNQTRVSKESLNQSNMSHVVKPQLPGNKSSYIQGPQTARNYNENVKYFKASQVIPSTPKPLARSESRASQQSQQSKGSRPCKKENIFVNPSKENSFEYSQDTLIEGKFLTSKELTNKLSISVACRNHKRTSSNHTVNGITRQISILQLQQQEENKQNRAKVHFHTARDIPSNNSIHDNARPWITSKTIDRLNLYKIDNDSLVHSLGTSQEQTPSSKYSGALSLMGREVSMTKKSQVKFVQCGQ